MATLLDIAPTTRKVKIRNKNIEVTGISVTAIAALVIRFQSLRKLFSEESEINVELILKHVPEALHSIIAAGTGYEGNEDAEKVASQLKPEEQLQLLNAIVEESFPSGLANFMKEVEGLVKELGSKGLIPSSQSSQKSASS